MNDLMVDLETLGCGSDAVITQIGACYFDRYTGNIGETFKVNIDIQDCIDQGFTIDGSTLAFWFDQSNRMDMLDHTIELRDALDRFRQFAMSCDQAWAHANFDFPILFTAYKKLGLGRLPFHYRAMRDLRTLVDLAGIDYKAEGQSNAHDALADCQYQVRYAVKCFNKLRDQGKDNV